jgi:hypothetical protein
MDMAIKNRKYPQSMLHSTLKISGMFMAVTIHRVNFSFRKLSILTLSLNCNCGIPVQFQPAVYKLDPNQEFHCSNSRKSGETLQQTSCQRAVP